MLRGPELVAATARTPAIGAAATLDVQATLAWRDVVAERDDSSQVEWLDGQRCALVRGDAVVAKPGLLRVDGRDVPYDRLVIATGPRRQCRRFRASRRSRSGRTSRRPRRSRCRGRWSCSAVAGRLRARAVLRPRRLAGDARPGRPSDCCRAWTPRRRPLVDEALRDDGDRAAARRTRPRSSSRRTILRLASGERIVFERLLIATGRRPNVAGLGAARAQHQRAGHRGRRAAARGRERLGDRRRDGNRAVHACRQVPRPIAAYDMAGRDIRADHRAIPATIFTDPQVATVGSLEGKVAMLEAHVDAAPLDVRASQALRLRQGRGRPRATRRHRSCGRRPRGR